MKISALLHIIRASRSITNHNTFFVIGSQAILGHCLEKGYDFEFHDSFEVDISSVPDSPVFADIISGALGEESPFHKEFGYCADGVEFCTAIFPDGWENRLLKTTLEGATVFFPSIEDLAISKYISNRQKDTYFITRLWQEELINPDIISELSEKIPPERIGNEKLAYVQAKIQADIERNSSAVLIRPN